MKDARDRLIKENWYANDIEENRDSKPTGWMLPRIAIMLAIQFERMIAELSNIHNELINIKGRMG